MRFSTLVLSSWVVLAAACVQRPPPIKSSPTGADPSSAPQCTVVNGIDPSGHPSCSDGCQWDKAQKACAPSPAAPPSPSSPQPPPNGA